MDLTSLSVDGNNQIRYECILEYVNMCIIKFEMMRSRTLLTPRGCPRTLLQKLYIYEGFNMEKVLLLLLLLCDVNITNSELGRFSNFCHSAIKQQQTSHLKWTYIKEGFLVDGFRRSHSRRSWSDGLHVSQLNHPFALLVLPALVVSQLGTGMHCLLETSKIRN